MCLFNREIHRCTAGLGNTQILYSNVYITFDMRCIYCMLGKKLFFCGVWNRFRVLLPPTGMDYVLKCPYSIHVGEALERGNPWLAELWLDELWIFKWLWNNVTTEVKTQYRLNGCLKRNPPLNSEESYAELLWLAEITQCSLHDKTWMNDSITLLFGYTLHLWASSNN